MSNSYAAIGDLLRGFNLPSELVEKVHLLDQCGPSCPTYSWARNASALGTAGVNYTCINTGYGINMDFNWIYIAEPGEILMFKSNGIIMEPFIFG
jgi:hypothetical protein